MSASGSGGRHRQLSVPGSRGKRDGEGMETRGVTWPPHDSLQGQAKARDSVTTAQAQAGCQMLQGPNMHMSSLPVRCAAVSPVPRTVPGMDRCTTNIC